MTDKYSDYSDYTENKEIKKALRKKVIVKAKPNKDLKDGLDFSVYGLRRQARIYAMFALYSYDINKGDIDIDKLLELECENRKLQDSVLLFAKDMINGTIEHLKEIDEIIEKYSDNWEIKRIQYVDRAVIRISIYCLLYHKEIPKSVVIDEAIEIAKIFSDKDSYKYINGILDGKEKKDIED